MAQTSLLRSVPRKSRETLRTTDNDDDNEDVVLPYPPGYCPRCSQRNPGRDLGPRGRRARGERDDDLARGTRGTVEKVEPRSCTGEERDRGGFQHVHSREYYHTVEKQATHNTHTQGVEARARARARRESGTLPAQLRSSPLALSSLALSLSLSLSLSPTASFPTVAEYIPPGERHHTPRTALAHIKRERVRARERGGGRRGRETPPPPSSSSSSFGREAPDSRRFGASEKNGSAAILVRGSRHLLCQLYQSVVVVRRRRRRRGAVSPLSPFLSPFLSRKTHTHGQFVRLFGLLHRN